MQERVQSQKNRFFVIKEVFVDEKGEEGGDLCGTFYLRGGNLWHFLSKKLVLNKLVLSN